MQVKETGVSNSMSFFLCYSSNPTTLFTNESPSEKRHNPPSTWSYCSICQRWFFISKWTPGFPIAPLLSIYWLWSMQDTDIFFIPAWYCTDCFSACHLRSLSPTDRTLFLSLWGKQSAHCHSLPWLWAWIDAWEWEFKGTAEGMMISYGIW